MLGASMAVRKKSKSKARARQRKTTHSKAKSSSRSSKVTQKTKTRAVTRSKSKVKLATRKLPKVSILKKKSSKKAKSKSSKRIKTKKPKGKAPKTARPKAPPPFRERVISGDHGKLVKIVEPIGYRDYLRGLSKLEKSEKYKALKKKYPKIYYTIYGNPGNNVFPDLETLQAFFETVYAPALQAIHGSRKNRTDWFANLVIYAVDRTYKAAPHPKRSRSKKKRYGRKHNATGRSI
jgi:hypothetical protein